MVNDTVRECLAQFHLLLDPIGDQRALAKTALARYDQLVLLPVFHPLVDDSIVRVVLDIDPAQVVQDRPLPKPLLLEGGQLTHREQVIQQLGECGKYLIGKIFRV